MDHQHDEMLADRRFLPGAWHAFLIRRPEEIAASYYALFPPMTINAIDMKRLCEMQAAITSAGGTPPVIIDSDDLVTRTAATMAVYCAAVGLLAEYYASKSRAETRAHAGIRAHNGPIARAQTGCSVRRA